jgi:hypothetical protein
MGEIVHESAAAVKFPASPPQRPPAESVGITPALLVRLREAGEVARA